MCGRMNISDHEGIREFLAYLELPLNWPGPVESEGFDFAAGFNIAPGSRLKVIHVADNTLQEQIMQWGIKPSWNATKQNKLPSMLMYARAETIWQKKPFARLVAKQRMVIPINGFYEWRRAVNVKQPFYFSPNDSGVCFLAGLFTTSADNQFQCCVLTRAAGELMTPVHLVAR